MGAHPVHRLPQQAHRHQPAPEAAAVLVGRLEGRPGQQEAEAVTVAGNGRLTAAKEPRHQRPTPGGVQVWEGSRSRCTVNKFEIHTKMQNSTAERGGRAFIQQSLSDLRR